MESGTTHASIVNPHLDTPLDEISGTGVDVALARTLVSASSTIAAPAVTPLTLHCLCGYSEMKNSCRYKQESLIGSEDRSWVAFSSTNQTLGKQRPASGVVTVDAFQGGRHGVSKCTIQPIFTPMFPIVVPRCLVYRSHVLDFSCSDRVRHFVYH